jgi:hypothetical protein
MAEQEKSKLSQKTVGAAIGAVALLGIGLIAIALVLIFKGNNGGTPTPIANTDVPSPSSTPTVTIFGIRSTLELATVEYLVVAEVQNERVPDDIRSWLGVKEEILMLVYGNVKAGFDLSKLTEDDLLTDGTQVQLVLPAPEILSLSIDNERSHVVYYDKSLIVGHDVELEGDTRRIADEAISKQAIEIGILDNAADYGQLYFENYLRSLGFTDVQVIIKQQAL